MREGRKKAAVFAQNTAAIKRKCHANAFSSLADGSAGKGRLGLSGLAVLTALLLGGCGFGGSPAQPETPPGPVTGFMIVSAVGETATVDDPDFGKGVRVSLDELFTSAKGEDCKRGTVLSGQREAEVIVICKDDQRPLDHGPASVGTGSFAVARLRLRLIASRPLAKNDQGCIASG